MDRKSEAVTNTASDGPSSGGAEGRPISSPISSSSSAVAPGSGGSGDRDNETATSSSNSLAHATPDQRLLRKITQTQTAVVTSETREAPPGTPSSSPSSPPPSQQHEELNTDIPERNEQGAKPMPEHFSPVDSSEPMPASYGRRDQTLHVQVGGTHTVEDTTRPRTSTCNQHTAAAILPGAVAVPGMSDNNNSQNEPNHETAEELLEEQETDESADQTTYEIAAYAVNDDDDAELQRQLEEENEALRRQVQQISEVPVAMASVLREKSTRLSCGDGSTCCREKRITTLFVCGVLVIGIALGTAAGIGLFRKDDPADPSGNSTIASTAADPVYPEQSMPTRPKSNLSQACWEKYLPDDGVANDTLGRRIAMYNGTVLIGASRSRDNAQRGAAYVYVLSEDGTWTQQDKLVPRDDIASEFGLAVGLHGNTAVIGSRWDKTDDGRHRGVGYVFERKGTGWEQTDMLRPTEWAVGDEVGDTVAIYANTIVLGADGDDEKRGAAYTFRRNGDKWRQQQKVVATARKEKSHFGRRVALDANYAVISADGVDLVHVFRFDGLRWNEDATLAVPVGLNETKKRKAFGSDVSIDGNNIIVGAFRDDFRVGSAYVFTLQNNGTWMQTAKITPSDGESGDQFGRHVVIKRDAVFISSKFDNDNGPKSGSVYVFRKVGDSWQEKAKLLPSDGAAGDEFGLGIAISNKVDTLAISSWRDDDNGYDAGSFYSIDLRCLYDDW